MSTYPGAVYKKKIYILINVEADNRSTINWTHTDYSGIYVYDYLTLKHTFHMVDFKEIKLGINIY